MRIKYFRKTNESSAGQSQMIMLNFSQDEIKTLFGEIPEKPRWTFTLENGLLVVKPVEATDKFTRSWSMWANQSKDWPWRSQVAVKEFESIELSAYMDLVEVETRKSGSTLHALLDMPKGSLAEPPTAPMVPSKPEPVQSIFDAPEDDGNPNPLLRMLEDAYNVNPSDRAVLKSALAIVNDQIRRSKGAIAPAIDPMTGEVRISIAKFKLDMENL